jgi:hypothetical protein
MATQLVHNVLWGLSTNIPCLRGKRQLLFKTLVLSVYKGLDLSPLGTTIKVYSEIIDRFTETEPADFQANATFWGLVG